MSTTDTLPSMIDQMLNRASAPRLVEPAPSKEHLEIILRAAANAPDHGKLKPWRFIVVAGEARERFGDLMARTLQQRDPAVSPEMLQRERDKSMRSPMIVVAAAKVNTASKIPAIEQVLAVAASVQNMILSAVSLGYGTMWKTGASAYDDAFKKGLGLEPTDQIVGYIYLGTPTVKTPPRDIKIDSVVSYF
jgi:nitroreductase